MDELVTITITKNQQEELLKILQEIEKIYASSATSFDEGMTRREFLRRLIPDINGAKPVSVLTPETLPLIKGQMPMPLGTITPAPIPEPIKLPIPPSEIDLT